MRTIITKICTRCGIEKPNTEFYFGRNPGGKKYSHRKCKQCCIELAKERYANLSDEDKKKKYHAPGRKEYNEEYRKLHTKSCILYSTKKRAKERGIECTISEDDIIIPEFCPYLGIKLITQVDSGLGKGRTFPNLVSIDRIDSTKGYIPGNVQMISHLANRMKNNATIEQLLEFARNVIKIHS